MLSPISFLCNMSVGGLLKVPEQWSTSTNYWGKPTDCTVFNSLPIWSTYKNFWGKLTDCSVFNSLTSAAKLSSPQLEASSQKVTQCNIAIYEWPNYFFGEFNDLQKQHCLQGRECSHIIYSYEYCFSLQIIHTLSKIQHSLFSFAAFDINLIPRNKKRLMIRSMCIFRQLLRIWTPSKTDFRKYNIWHGRISGNMSDSRESLRGVGVI